MKKDYIIPEMEITEFEVEDVIEGSVDSVNNEMRVLEVYPPYNS